MVRGSAEARRQRADRRPAARNAILCGIHHRKADRMTGSDGREIYRVVWPRGARTVQASNVAPRLDTLEGKTVAQLWDYLFRGDEIFAILEEGWQQRYPGREVRELARLRHHPRRRRERGARRAAASASRSWASTPSSPAWRVEGAARPPCCGRVRCAKRAGLPTSSLVCEGFLGQAAATVGRPRHARHAGRDGARPSSARRATRSSRRNVAAMTTLARGDRQPDRRRRDAIGAVGRARARATSSSKAASTRSTAIFYEHEWSDGLPIVPPTRERDRGVPALHADRDPDESARRRCCPTSAPRPSGASRSTASWPAAGPSTCRSWSRSIEAMCDPKYGVEHSGNTPGAETLIILNGPIIKELGFNYEQGVLRDGFQANTSIGRFWRLYLRNVAGFLLHKTDKGTFGNTWRVVLAENEDVLKDIGWPTIAQDAGVAGGDNTVTIARYTGGARHPLGLRPQRRGVRALPCRRAHQVHGLGADLHRRHDHRNVPAAARALADHRAHHRELGLDQGAVAAGAVRAGAHPGAAVRELPVDVDQPGPGTAQPLRHGQARQGARRSSANRAIPTGSCRSCSSRRTS